LDVLVHEPVAASLEVLVEQVDILLELRDIAQA
jgi:hypothetical protein